MRRALVVAAVVALAACSSVVLGGSSTTTSTIRVTTTSTATTLPSTTSTTRPSPVGGYLVKYDVETLRPIAGLDPIPMGMNSSTISSDDREWMMIIEYTGQTWDTVRQMTAVDVTNWEVSGVFDGVRHSARAIHGGVLFMYDHSSGAVSSLDVRSGRTEALGSWSKDFWMWDDLRVLPNGRLVGLGTNETGGDNPARYSVVWLDPVSGERGEVQIGSIQRSDPETGVFDGDYEIPEWDHPGIAWGDDRLFVVHADGPEVTAADLTTGEVETRSFDQTTWFDRLLAFWVPPASAKGPSLGTNSSAALTPDGRFLLISGNRYEVVEGSDGSVIEESTHLGLTVIDTETWHVVDRPDLPFQFVRESGDVVIGVDTRSTSPWIEDVYVVSTDAVGTVSHLGPFEVRGGGCFKTVGESPMVCSSYSETSQSLNVIDLGTGEKLARLGVGMEDSLLENGVLEDRAPFTTGTKVVLEH